jgi:hypothetical protein
MINAPGAYATFVWKTILKLENQKKYIHMYISIFNVLIPVS